MSLSYPEAEAAADVSAIRSRLRIAWSHRALVRIYQTVDRLNLTCSQASADRFLLPILGLFLGVVLGLWFT